MIELSTLQICPKAVLGVGVCEGVPISGIKTHWNKSVGVGPKAVVWVWVWVWVCPLVASKPAGIKAWVLVLRLLCGCVCEGVPISGMNTHWNKNVCAGPKAVAYVWVCVRVCP